MVLFNGAILWHVRTRLKSEMFQENSVTHMWDDWCRQAESHQTGESSYNELQPPPERQHHTAAVNHTLPHTPAVNHSPHTPVVNHPLPHTAAVNHSL